MRKITLIALCTLMLGVTQAEYQVKIPLEQAQGGSLPNASIVIGDSLGPFPGPIEDIYARECIYDINDSYWVEYENFRNSTVVWKGTTLLINGLTPDGQIASGSYFDGVYDLFWTDATGEGYFYSRGSTIGYELNNDGNEEIYENRIARVCRAKAINTDPE